jgi:hypothetical protein
MCLLCILCVHPCCQPQSLSALTPTKIPPSAPSPSIRDSPYGGTFQHPIDPNQNPPICATPLYKRLPIWGYFFNIPRPSINRPTVPPSPSKGRDMRTALHPILFGPMYLPPPTQHNPWLASWAAQAAILPSPSLHNPIIAHLRKPILSIIKRQHFDPLLE